jgi:hypothetical protein
LLQALQKRGDGGLALRVVGSQPAKYANAARLRDLLGIRW